MGLFAEMVRYEGIYLLILLIYKILVAALPRLKHILRWFRQRAVFLHEFAHYFMMKILFVPVKLSDIHVSYTGSGYVRVPKFYKKNFMKFFHIFSSFFLLY